MSISIGRTGRARGMFRVLTAAAFSALVVVGCSEKSNDDGGGGGELTEDWQLVEMGYEDGWDRDFIKPIGNQKVFYSFTSSSDIVKTGLSEYSDFWIGSSALLGKYILKGDSICVDGECLLYSISGNTLTLRDCYDSRCRSSYQEKLVRVDLANIKKSLGKVYSQDTKLVNTEWINRSESRIEFYSSFWDTYSSGFYDVGNVYITNDYYDDGGWKWYSENSRITLVGLGECTECEEKENSDDCERYGESYAPYCSIAETVTLDYELSNGNKTLRLRRNGSNEWDEWTLIQDNDY